MNCSLVTYSGLLNRMNGETAWLEKMPQSNGARNGPVQRASLKSSSASVAMREMNFFPKNRSDSLIRKADWSDKRPKKLGLVWRSIAFLRLDVISWNSFPHKRKAELIRALTSTSLIVPYPFARAKRGLPASRAVT